VKGQRLFVREATPDDSGELGVFYASESIEPPVPLDSEGVIARLVGNLVAHLTWQIDGGRARIRYVHVASALRGKRIGRGLISDAAVIAAKRNVEQLVVAADCPAREFFLRTGFADVGHELVREVS